MEKQPVVLVLGVQGMLGSMVFSYLSRNPGLTVYGTSRSEADFSARVFLLDAAKEIGEQLSNIPTPDYIINCIGIIKPYCKDDDPAGVRNAIAVNALFPHRLSEHAKRHGIRLIQIATDCVYSGAKGKYLESDPHDALDVYGKSKSLGEVFDGLNIRCSIIGPERKGKLSLLEWFLNQPDGATLNGFTHHFWNGITTLRFAKLCEQIILQDACEALLKASRVHHYVPADIVDKHQLLTLFKETFGKQVTIVATNTIGTPVDRTLATKHHQLARLLPPITIAEDLRELKEHMEERA